MGWGPVVGHVLLTTKLWDRLATAHPHTLMLVPQGAKTLGCENGTPLHLGAQKRVAAVLQGAKTDATAPQGVDTGRCTMQEGGRASITWVLALPRLHRAHDRGPVHAHVKCSPIPFLPVRPQRRLVTSALDQNSQI